MRKDITVLIKSLEYSFKDFELLRKALLHSSSKLNGDDKNNSNELQYGCITQNGKLVCGNRYK